jgi:hypothetical protein
VRRVEQRAQAGISWFYVVETGVLGASHLHTLTIATAVLDVAALAAAWQCGRSQVAEYKAGGEAAVYVTKHVAAPNTHYDLHFRPRHIRGILDAAN